ncbi:Dihydroxyacetone kinase family protein [Staphylococcus aureus]|uniref:Dihydroxyacetone kinase family protein n=1 Tax=Staphylococcus aureus TaxID=1280 RepID=A0A2X2K2M8_STAAU|nr:Dihydroxyacetone kinase family protein [Staphylococcus aureus]
MLFDSGGKGLLCVYEGFLKALKGEKVEAKVAKLDKDEFVHDEHDFHGVINTEDIIYGYCTEMMVRFWKRIKKPLMNRIQARYESIW